MSTTTYTDIADRIAAIRDSALERNRRAIDAYVQAKRGAGLNEPFEAVEYEAAGQHASHAVRLADQYAKLTGPQPWLATWTMDDVVRALYEYEDAARRAA